MKTRITWFVVGALVATAGWFSVSAYLNRPKDYTGHWPDALRERKDCEYLKRAHGFFAGPLIVLSPASSKHEVLAEVWFRGDQDKSDFPAILVQDLSGNGIADAMTIVDKSQHSLFVSDDNEDRTWDRFIYSPESSSNSISFVDKNMDGTFDLRIGPGNKKTVIKKSKENF